MHALFFGQIPQNNRTFAFPVDPIDMGTVIYNNPDNPCYLGQLLLISTPKVLGHLRISGNRQKTSSNVQVRLADISPFSMNDNSCCLYMYIY